MGVDSSVWYKISAIKVVIYDALLSYKVKSQLFDGTLYELGNHELKAHSVIHNYVTDVLSGWRDE